MPIKLKRAYELPAESDGARILVERLWPRGVKKAALRLDGWAKDAAPSVALRKWFGHDPARWEAFRRRYFAELEERPEAIAGLLQAARTGVVTFVYSAHDPVHNNAAALKEYLEARARRRTAPAGAPRVAQTGTGAAAAHVRRPARADSGGAEPPSGQRRRAKESRTA